MNTFDYRDKRVVVNGCHSGMGEATARLLLAAGAEVHGLDVADTVLPLASFTRLDLREPAAIDAAVAALPTGVDALFNCAGLPHTSPPGEVMRVNYLGIRHFTEGLVPKMARGGAIATISSRAGRAWQLRRPLLEQLLAIDDFHVAAAWCDNHPNWVREGYVLAKEMIILWTLAWSSRLVHQGIRINCTLPGSTQTPMMGHFQQTTDASLLDEALFPTGRRSVPEEQAWPLLFLNSSAASYVNGVALPVDGGFMAAATTDRLGFDDPIAAEVRRSLGQT